MQHIKKKKNHSKIINKNYFKMHSNVFAGSTKVFGLIELKQVHDKTYTHSK